MKKKEISLGQEGKDRIRYRIIFEYQVNFGEAVYLLGNIQQLGQWKPQSSIRLLCYEMKFWIADVQIPVQTNIEYKFFVSTFQTQSQLTLNPMRWVGDQQNQNFKLFISKQQARLIENERKLKDLKLMSFNIRRERQSDKDEYSWQIRKYNCVRVIKQQFPSIIGIQQATVNQRNYLQQNLKYFYNYISNSLDPSILEQVGIFYNKQRFILVESGYRWISQTQKPGSIGLGASSPRLISYAIFQDTYNSQRFRHDFHAGSLKKIIEIPRQLILVQNIYLDFHATQSQKKGITMLVQGMKSKFQEYKEEIKDAFMLGDFNLPQNSNLLHILQKSQFRIQSIRKSLLRKHMKDACDMSYTFHAFEHDEHDIENPQKIIDHIYISSKDYEPIRFEVIRSLAQKVKHSKNPIISDHYPIMGVFKHKRNQLKLQHLKA